MKKTCPLCGNKNTYKFWEENNYIGNKCFKCKLVFIVNGPTKQQLVNYYNDKSDSDLSLNLPTKIKEVACLYSLSKIKTYKKSGNLLELGSGYGLFLSLAKNFGFNVSGIEINQKQAKYLSKKLKFNVYEGLIEEKIKELKTGYYDVIYHRDVLSHMYNPQKTFIELNRILKNDGLLIFETGNYGGISKFWYKIKKKVGYPEHLFFFSDESIIKLLKKSNFKRLKKYTVSTVLLILKQIIKPENKGSSFNKKSGNYNRRNLIRVFLEKIAIILSFRLLVLIGKIQPKSFPAKEIHITVRNK